MIKQEIIEKISQFFKLTTYDAEKILDDIFSKIMTGVKDDNIVDIANFGEFIVKYNNGKNGTPAPYKKTIEFLPSTVLEEEIGHKNYDLIRKQVYKTIPQSEEYVKPLEKSEVKPVEPIVNKVEEPVKEPEIKEFKEPFKEPFKELEKKFEESQQKKSEPETHKIEESQSSTESIENDFKKKREALLNKISIHPLQDSESVKKPEIREFHYNIPKEDTSKIELQKQEFLKKQEEEKKKLAEEEIKRKLAAEEEKRKLEEETKNRLVAEEEKRKIEEETKLRLAEEENKRKLAAEEEKRRIEEEASRKVEEEKLRLAEEEKKKEIEAKQKVESETKIVPPIVAPVEEDISQKSFADYFTEVKPEDKVQVKPTVEEKQPIPSVIPKEAVELHQQITNTTVGAFPTQTIQTADQFIEHRAEDKSYYIWYKDSEPNVNETQTMTYEYELLYQATKEAEYKSKLRIYVTTFILFFSIVLVLLIFSPVIYKIFFTPPAENQENFQNSEQNPNGPTSYDQKATLNVPPISINQNNVVADTLNNAPNNSQNTQPNVSEPNQTSQQQDNKQQGPPPANVNQQNTSASQQPGQEKTQVQQTPQTQTQQQQSQQNTTPKVDGVSKTTMGWSDEKLKVVYVQLENGKYAIQESAWDSDAKASKRISLVESLKIDGMKGTVVKADLGSKGVWYRARFGEFNTIQDAKQKAEELRSREKVRFQTALLMYFLLYA